MSSRILILLVVAGAAITAWGCTTEKPGPTGGGQASLPDRFFLSQKPDALPLLEVKKTASVGDEVAFEARIGGRADPFVASRAIVMMVDPVLET